MSEGERIGIKPGRAEQFSELAEQLAALAVAYTCFIRATVDFDHTPAAYITMPRSDRDLRETEGATES